MNKSTLVASIFVTASLLSSVTFAAPAPFNWTGFYAGVNVGAVKHTMNITDNEATAFLGTIQEASNPDISGGFQLGYRRQLDLARVSNVYGLEFSTNFSDNGFNQVYGSPFALYQLNSENKLKNVSLLQVTGGIAADRTLLFLAAGMSWSTISGSVTSVDGAPFFNSFNLNKTAFGTALGAGLEFAFTNAISARVKVDVISPDVYSTSNNVGNSYQISNNIVQGTFAMNYKFA
jgi:opacity protein-like surface antigen